MKQKILGVLLSIALVIALLPATAVAAYTDVTNHWAQAAVTKWSEMGIVKGSDGNFRPNDSITRGEMAVIIDRIMKYQTASKNSFNDLGNDFYTDAIGKANAAGVILGSGNMVRPLDYITREEAAVMIGRLLGLKESKVTSGFNDSDSISSWAMGYINAMNEKGFIHGSNGVFNPKASIKRAEIVTILDNAIGTIYSEAKEYTGSLKGTVVINTPGVKLTNMTIDGDLIISEGVGSGNVNLDNVKITGNTIVRGGGEHSLYFNNVSVEGGITVRKDDEGSVRIVVSGSSEINAVLLETGAILVTQQLTGGGIKEVLISADFIGDSPIELIGSYTNVTNENGGAKIVMKDAAITNLNLKEDANVTGTGSIKNANIGANAGEGTTLPVKPENISGSGSSTIKVPDSSNGGSSSGGNGGGTSGGGSGGTPSSGISVTVNKVANINQNDSSFNVSQANQDAVNVSKSGNTITVTGKLALLNEFQSNTVSQGSHKWVGLAINTGESSIIGISYNGSPLTQADVDEAATNGVGAGSFILWIKADEVVNDPKSFTLSKTGMTSVTITVKFTDTTSTIVATASKVKEINSDDIHYKDSQANQNAVTIAQANNAVTVTGNLALLNSFESNSVSQGTHKWIGLAIDTGETSIIGVSYNGIALTQEDVNEAKTNGVGAGSFILWIKAEEVATTPITFTLSKAGMKSASITVNFNDTTPNMTITVSKVTDINSNDVNATASQANQNAVTVAQVDNTVNITGDLAALNSFQSNTSSQDTHKWVGLVINSGEPSIKGLSYNGAALTQADIDEATANGVGAGSFILWIKADEVVTAPKTFTISKAGYADTAIKVNFVDKTVSITDASDALTFNVIKKDNINEQSIVGNLTLPASLPEYPGITINWQSSDESVISNSGTVIRPASNESDVSVTLIATLNNGTITKTKDFVLIVRKMGIDNVTINTKDSYFDDNYPTATVKDDGFVWLSFKLNKAAEVYITGSKYNSAWDSSVEGVLHGHADSYNGAKLNDAAQVDYSGYKNVIDPSNVVELNTHITPNSGNEIKINFVVKDTANSYLSSSVTTIKFDLSTVSATDTTAPHAEYAAINEAKSQIFLYFSEALNLTSIPEIDDFTLSQGSVTGVKSYNSNKKSGQIKSWIVLSVTGVTNNNVQISYTPDVNRIKDDIGNACSSFNVTSEDASISIKSVNVNATAGTMTVTITPMINSEYEFPSKSMLSVTNNGAAIAIKQDSWVYSYDYITCTLYFDPIKTGSTNFAVIFNPTSGVKDMANDAVSMCAFNGAVNYYSPVSTSSIEATYSKSTGNITLNFGSGIDLESRGVRGCSFFLTVNGTTYQLRGTINYVNYQNHNLVYVDVDDSVPTLDDSDVITISYNPHITSTYCILTDAAGAPVSDFGPVSVSIEP